MGGIAAGDQHSLVVSREGGLYSFGGGACHGHTAIQLAPRLVAALQSIRVLAVATGASHSLVLNEAGEIYSFGYGGYGELGHGDTESQLMPLKIAGLQGVRVRSIAAGTSTSLAVTSDGEAYGWGRGLGHIVLHEDEEENVDVNLVLGLELTDHQLVPLKYPGLHLHA